MLATMNQDRWNQLPETERAKVRDLSGLTRQLNGYENTRVEVIRQNGERARFWVGRSTGWIPCHLEIARTNSSGGFPADRDYQSVILIRRRRR